jgi:mycothiol synthase
MLRPNLDGLPPLQLPQGYELRTYRPGDDVHWTSIVSTAFQRDPAGMNFDMLRKDAAFLPERIFFIWHTEEPVATASAWLMRGGLPDAGWVHYVAVLPGHTGKRLGYWVSLATLQRMVAEGRKRGWLSTDDFRLPAIKTYLNLGFEPLLINENQRERWRKVFADLGLPRLCESFAQILNGPVCKMPDYPPCLQA